MTEKDNEKPFEKAAASSTGAARPKSDYKPKRSPRVVLRVFRTTYSSADRRDSLGGLQENGS